LLFINVGSDILFFKHIFFMFVLYWMFFDDI